MDCLFTGITIWAASSENVLPPWNETDGAGSRPGSNVWRGGRIGNTRVRQLF